MSEGKVFGQIERIEMFTVEWNCSWDGIVRRGMGLGRKTGVSRFQLSSAVDTETCSSIPKN